MELERFFDELADESKPLRHAELTVLSGIAGKDLDLVRTRWPKLPAARRNETANKLLALAEDNAELNFDSVFSLSLKDQDEQVRERGIAGLWESDSRATLMAFIQLLRCDPSPKVRAAAAQALGRFSELCQEKKLPSRDKDKLQEVLLAAATNMDEPVEVRRRALESGAAFEHEQVTRLIKDAYQAADLKFEASALFAMGRNGDPMWIPIVYKELSNVSAEMRYEAATACGLLGELSAVSKLLSLLRDDDMQVQLAAIEALGQIGGPTAKKALQVAAKSGEDNVREAAEEALDHMEFLDDPLSFRTSL
ncbi:MAG: HEAT repeat domain-containing protein [Dehalococcoidia bacterium]|nr:HEAT repeat domain-containing protein [Dehalococcoidia bacterium]